MYIPTKYGRILYVSKEGNNSSAEVGNPSRPWETPQDARDAASNGDLIYVFPGTYTYGNSDSGADYVGLGTGGTYTTDQEVALNYGKSAINYYFEPGVTLQGITGAAVPRAIIYEPFGLPTASENPCTLRVYGYMNVDTTGEFLQITHRDSDFEVEFNEVINCTAGVKLEASYDSVGGDVDIPYAERLVVRGNKLTCSTQSIKLGVSGNTLASNGRTSLTRGYISVDIQEVTGGEPNAAWLYNYDVFVNVNRLEVPFFYLSALKNTITHVNIGEYIFSAGNNGAFEECAVMTDSELYINAGRVTHTSGNVLGIVWARNTYGTGGKVFIHVDSGTANTIGTQKGVIGVGQDAVVFSRVTLHNGGFEGETVITVSGNYFEENDSMPVVDTEGTSFATGASGNILLNLKNCTLIHTGAGTNSIAATVGAGTDYLIQGCYANLPVDGNANEVGQAVIVDSNYK